MSNLIDFYNSIEIPLTNLRNGKIRASPKENYPVGIIEWLDNQVVLERLNKTWRYKIRPSEDEVNDINGWSRPFQSKATARKYAIKVAANLVGNEAWEWNDNPPINSIFHHEQ